MRKLATLLLLGSLATVRSQQVSENKPAGQPPSSPTFRTGTKLVEVDVVARDKHGPAAGLKKADFTIFDNGTRQEISIFSVKAARSTKSVDIPAPAPLPPGAVSNRLNRDGEASPTATVLLLDQLNTTLADQAYAIQRIVMFLDTRRAQDRLAIYTLGSDVAAVQDLTTDNDLLRRAASSLKPTSVVHRTLHKGDFDKAGRALDEYTSAVTRERVIGTKQALESIARQLATVPGRKSLVWITDSFPLVIHKPRAVDEIFSPQVQDTARVLSEANVAVYPVDARGLVTGFNRDLVDVDGLPLPPGSAGLNLPGFDTMNLVAGLTGGQAYYANNGIEDSIQKIVEDGELVYTLGFYPSQDVQDGRWHKLQVKVARSGLGIRYREKYFAPVAAASVPVNDRAKLKDLFTDTLDAGEIGLLVQATADPARPGLFSVRATVDLHDLKLEHEGNVWTGSLAVSFYVQGSHLTRTTTSKLKIGDDQLSASLEKGIVLDGSVEAPASGEVLRVVAQDLSTGAAGSLRIPLGGK